MPDVILTAWDATNKVYRRLVCNADGKLIIDPSEIFEYPPTEGETAKGGQSAWCYDHWKDPNAHHDRQHALSSASDHTGEITDAQHGERTKTDAHAHSDLSGIGVSDHHARYTDAEARAAAVSDAAYGDGWNGVTNIAPSKNAVYDKIETLGAATKEIFIPVHYATDMDPEGGLVDGSGDEAGAALLVPQDFSSLTSIEVIFLPRATGANMHFNMYSSYGAYNGGETYNAHYEYEVARDIGATINSHNLAHSISNLVDAGPLTKGDVLHVKVSFNFTEVASNAYVRGIRLKYT